MVYYFYNPFFFVKFTTISHFKQAPYFWVWDF